MSFCVAALYHFAEIADPEAKKSPLRAICVAHKIKGILLLAREGINGTIEGSDDGVAEVIAHIESWEEIGALEVKYSRSSEPSFLRMRVRLKEEIVTMGQPMLNLPEEAGTYVDPGDWNELIKRDGVMVIDTRNRYETRIGQFAGATDPETDSFKDFPAWAKSLAKNLAQDKNRPKAIAMYCTGGIRCEKASAYMKQLGFDEVYHLKGGILKYLEQIPENQSLWQGECFVFDKRVTLLHELKEGNYELCYACKEPVSPEDRQSPDFEQGVSCPYCIGKTSPAQLKRFRERQKQIALAAERGEKHLGEK